MNIDLRFPDSEKIYVTAPDSDIKVGMRRLALQNGDSITLYDTSGAYTDPRVDTSCGLPKVRAAWNDGRINSAEGFHTQLWYAKRGIITPEMRYVATRENQGATGDKAITAEQVCRDIAAGHAVLPSNRMHPECEPMIIGPRYLVKINANIGNSALGSDTE